MAGPESDILKLARAVEVAAAAFEKEATALLHQKRSQLDDLAKDVDKADKAQADADKRQMAQAAKMIQQAFKVLDNNIADYTRIIRESDGLITASPAVTRALDRYRKGLKDEDRTAALAVLTKQRAEILSKHGPDNDQAKETADALQKIIRSLK
jgi:hypothetical protein